MLTIHLRLDLPSGLFPSGFPTNNPCNRLLLLNYVCISMSAKRFFAQFLRTATMSKQHLLVKMLLCRYNSCEQNATVR
jgi:hypothetical protein